jgi:hypothetical protein
MSRLLVSGASPKSCIVKAKITLEIKSVCNNLQADFIFF